jgi:hypothetical protein
MLPYYIVLFAVLMLVSYVPSVSMVLPRYFGFA